MADIELVIKIPKQVYSYIRKRGYIANSDILDIKGAIIDGTPLPKGHGRLIDVSNLLTVTEYDGENEKTYVPYSEIENAPTIIEQIRRIRNDTWWKM